MSSLLAHPDHARLIRHLDNVAVLSDSDKQALCTLPLVIKVFDADEEVVHERDRVGSCCLLLDGFMHRYKVLANGERQIIAFHFPGDIPDLLTLHLSIMDHNLGTLVPSRLAFIAHSALRSLALERPGIGVALWRDTLIDASVFREWIVNVGRRDARERISHLLCEIYMRLNAVGLAETDGYALHLDSARNRRSHRAHARARQPHPAGPPEIRPDRLREPVPAHSRLARTAGRGGVRFRLSSPARPGRRLTQIRSGRTVIAGAAKHSKLSLPGPPSMRIDTRR